MKIQKDNYVVIHADFDSGFLSCIGKIQYKQPRKNIFNIKVIHILSSNDIVWYKEGDEIFIPKDKIVKVSKVQDFKTFKEKYPEYFI